MSTCRPTPPPLSLPVEAEEPHPAPGLFAGSSSTDPQQLTDAERLRAQRELQILDTPREDRFARVVRLARRLFGVPMVVVALVENDGRWSTASAGLDAHGGPGGEAFSNAVIQSSTPLVVTDTRVDRRFGTIPWSWACNGSASSRAMRWKIPAVSGWAHCRS
jgi:hypothetical protein